MRRALLLALACAALAGPALADPCEAVKDRGPIPPAFARGQVFAGPVVYVGDGDGLCVDVGDLQKMHTSPGAGWVEVRVADFYAPETDEPGGAEAKATLSRLVMGRHVECVAQHRSWDRIVAVCRLGGVSVGELMRGAGVQPGGRGR